MGNMIIYLPDPPGPWGGGDPNFTKFLQHLPLCCRFSFFLIYITEDPQDGESSGSTLKEYVPEFLTKSAHIHSKDDMERPLYLNRGSSAASGPGNVLQHSPSHLMNIQRKMSNLKL